MNKLGLDEAEQNDRMATLLQRKLRDGGWGLTPAPRTSPAAFLSSLTACHAEPSFAEYCGDAPLPCSSLLCGWIEDSLQRVRRAEPSDEYQADIEPLLPATAGAFFSFHSTADPSVTATLQRSLSAKANSHIVKAAVESAKEKSRQWGQERVGAPQSHHSAGRVGLEGRGAGGSLPATVGCRVCDCVAHAPRVTPVSCSLNGGAAGLLPGVQTPRIAGCRAVALAFLHYHRKRRADPSTRRSGGRYS